MERDGGRMMARMSDIDIDTRTILEYEAEQLSLDTSDKLEYISSRYTYLSNILIKEKSSEMSHM